MSVANITFLIDVFQNLTDITDLGWLRMAGGKTEAQGV